METRVLKYKGMEYSYEYEKVAGENWYIIKRIKIGNETYTINRRASSIEELDEIAYSYGSSTLEVIANEKRMKKVVISGIIGGVILIAALVILYTSTYKIPNGQQAVLKNSFTGDSRVQTDAGFKTKLPWEDVKKVSIGEQTYDREDSANTSDNVQLTYNFKVSYKLVDVDKFWNQKYNLSKDTQQTVINKSVTKVLDKVSNKYDYDYIKGNIASVGDEMTALATDSLTNYGIEIIGVDIVDIAAPESIDNAINNKIKKQQEAEASKYEIEKAENEAKAQKVKEESVSSEQQQMELCQNAIDAGNGNSPSCYFGNGTYVTGGTTSTK